MSEARHAPLAPPAGTPAGTPAATSAEPPDEPPQRPVVAASTWILEHAQDVVTVTVGVVLIVLAGTLAVSGVVTFITDILHKPGSDTIASSAIVLLDRVLLVLILVEIVHTVVLSLRAHRLAALPFIVVGLVAVIRRILFLLSNENNIPTAELGLLIGMVVAFVAAYLAVSHFERRDSGELAPEAAAARGPDGAGAPGLADPGNAGRPGEHDGR